MEDIVTVLRAPTSPQRVAWWGCTVLSREVLWVWWPREQALGAGLLDSTAHLLSCWWTLLFGQHPAATAPLSPSCAPFSAGQEGFGCRAFGNRAGQSTAVLQWWGQRSGVFWDVDGECQCPGHPSLSGLHKVSLLSPFPPGQCFHLCQSVPRAPACKERSLVSQA